MTIASLFIDYHLTEIDVTIDGNTIKKPPHISCVDWLDAWNGDDKFKEGYEAGRRGEKRGD